MSSENPLKETLYSCRIMLIYMLIFGCVLNMLMLATPIYSMQVLDRVLSSGNIDTLLALSAVVLLAIALSNIIQGARSFATNKMGIWFEKQLSPQLFRNSIKISTIIKGNANSQQLRDLQTIKSFLISPAVMVMLDLPWSMIFMTVLFILHVYMGFLALFGGMLLIGVGVWADYITRNNVKKNDENFLKSMRYVDESTRNAEVIESMSMFGNVFNSWQKLNNIVQHTQSETTSTQVVFAEVTKLIRTILQISVTGLGAYLTVKGDFSSGAIIASSTLVAKALSPFEAAINAWRGFVRCRQSYDRITESFVNEESEDRIAVQSIDGYIDLNNVSFAPVGSQKYTVFNINMSLEAGRTLVILGESGSGKTSILKIIAGIWQPAKGIMRIDGMDIKNIDKNGLGASIGYLPQNVELFSGTVAQNIARMNEEAHDEDILNAAKMAGAHEMISNLPNGYNTDIGVEGSMLSGGQRQRIGLARAFFGNPKILLLDEPNASLDSSGDQALINAIERAKARNITVVVISHRNTILSIADKIAIVHKGQIAIYGDRDAVIHKMRDSIDLASSVQQDNQNKS